MTTIVYDGKYFAADKRLTANSSSDTQCIQCGSNKKRINNNQTKVITDFKDSLFNKEKLICAAGAGKTSCVAKLIVLLANNVKLLADLNTLKYFETLDSLNGTGILFVTNKHVYSLYVSKNDYTYNRYPLSTKISIGSGEDIAKNLIEVFELNAMMAVSSVSYTDEGTGGGIDYIDCSLGPNQKVTTIPIHSKQEIKDALIKQVRIKEVIESHKQRTRSSKRTAILPEKMDKV